jgi:hypothetical protein
LVGAGIRILGQFRIPTSRKYPMPTPQKGRHEPDGKLVHRHLAHTAVWASGKVLEKPVLAESKGSNRQT